ncbi:type 2 isopentenyl-diphosphate Delta-isomerase [Lactobacillus sp.]|uniref:type 2 isopentenyl-diphosphate Delta-isomerase n=1 Tax=Lactobacillus sp. TaxID=1591 RepID=UPI0019986D91|nr:type 2 isopentenyl-diphosphate Delta-isomerase [Lactobacillus sp.]MBD5429365.1 type 2 isopentenyl-diphosphate Delta-isomerase [Lactobacillus sp.]
MSQRSQRKEEHLALAKMFFSQNNNSDFDKVHLLRPALPESTVNTQSIQTSMFGKKISAPFFVNAMTGGSKKSFEVNKRLAKACSKENIAMSLGSASILEKEPDKLDSFLIARQENPDGLLFANVNPDTDPKVAQKIVNELHADALQIHINVLQEIVMPEGDRNFHWLKSMQEIRQQVDVPIIVKEVGSGITPDDLRTLIEAGFNTIDLGGSGGTNFSQIENHRREDTEFNFIDNLGLSTTKCLLAAQKSISPKTLIASGGITNALQIFKALVLGADYVGIANLFLQYATKSEDALIQEINTLKEQLIALCAIFGIDSINKASNIKYYLDSDLINFINQIN